MFLFFFKVVFSIFTCIKLPVKSVNCSYFLFSLIWTNHTHITSRITQWYIVKKKEKKQKTFGRKISLDLIFHSQGLGHCQYEFWGCASAYTCSLWKRRLGKKWTKGDRVRFRSLQSCVLRTFYVWYTVSNSTFLHCFIYMPI